MFELIWFIYFMSLVSGNVLRDLILIRSLINPWENISSLSVTQNQEEGWRWENTQFSWYIFVYNWSPFLNTNHIYMIKLVFLLSDDRVRGTLTEQADKMFLIFFSQGRKYFVKPLTLESQYHSVILILPFCVIVQGHRSRRKSLY